MSQRNVKSVPAGWMDGVGERLIRHAARRAPESLSQRLQEEWLADWAARSSTMSRLRLAIGCCWATRVIALEFQPSRLRPAPAGSSASSEVYATRPLLLAALRHSASIVLSLHALLFYGLITTVTHFHVSAVDPLQNLPPTDSLPQRSPVPVPKPALTDVRLHVPPIDREIWRGEPDRSTDVTTIPDPQPPFTPPPPLQAVKQVLGGPGAGFPNTDDFYPPQARRLDEQGVGTVQVCVDANGRLTADPTMLQGTGSARLDAGAIKLARAGSGHYRATTVNDQPVNSCYSFRVRFQLKS